MSITARRARTTTVDLLLPGADAAVTHRVCSALNESVPEDVRSITSAGPGSVQLEVVRGTMLADLQGQLGWALQGTGQSFVIDAPADDTDSPVVLTATGWLYQMICRECGSYERDADEPNSLITCNGCLDDDSF